MTPVFQFLWDLIREIVEILRKQRVGSRSCLGIYDILTPIRHSLYPQGSTVFIVIIIVIYFLKLLIISYICNLLRFDGGIYYFIYVETVLHPTITAYAHCTQMIVLCNRSLLRTRYSLSRLSRSEHILFSEKPA